MNDLISRQAAVDAYILHTMDCLVGKKPRRAFTEVLRELPPAEPERSSEIQDILDYLDTALHPIISPEHWNVYSELHDMISTLSSAQPEIVRCGRCKYAEVADTQDNQDGYTCQFHRGSIWFSGSYCSWGERRTDEGD